MVYSEFFSLSFFFLLYFYVFIWSNFYSPYHMLFILYLRVFLRYYQEFCSCKRFFKLNQTIFDTNVQNLMNLYFLDIIYHFDLPEKPIKNICWLPVNVYDKKRTLILKQIEMLSLSHYFQVYQSLMYMYNNISPYSIDQINSVQGMFIAKKWSQFSKTKSV